MCALCNVITIYTYVFTFIFFSILKNTKFISTPFLRGYYLPVCIDYEHRRKGYSIYLDIL